MLLPIISHQAVVQLLVQAQAMLSALLVLASAFRLPVQVLVKVVLAHQQHAQTVQLDHSLLGRLVIRPVILLSRLKHWEGLFIVRPLVLDNMFGGMEVAFLLALMQRAIVLMQSSGRLSTLFRSANTHVLQMNFFLGMHLV